MALLVVYDRHAVFYMLCEWSVRQLHDELKAGRFGVHLLHTQTTELEGLLTAWLQRALGPMALRDAMLVDPARGRRVFALLCMALTTAQARLPKDLAATLPIGADLISPPAAFARHPALLNLARQAAADNLSLGVLASEGDFPLPDQLEALSLPLPRTFYHDRRPGFEPPVGWRRGLAVLCAISGVALLVGPLLFGQIPVHPAGPPLALITLALLIGIKASWAGFIGALCIWLVANLPGFRHGATLQIILWPALPLMGIGMLLLLFDRRVRGLLAWLQRQLRPGHQDQAS